MAFAEVDWPVADRMERVVRTVRVQNVKRVKLERIGERREKEKEEVLVHSTDFYATNATPGAIPSQFIRLLGRSRWTIDSAAFQTLYMPEPESSSALPVRRLDVRKAV